jgi:hypothetical protein
MKTKSIASLAVLLMASSCNLIESIKPDGKIGGTQSIIGEVGNSFSIGGLSGVSGFEAEVKTLEDGVSNINGSITITDTKMREILKTIPEYTWNGNKMTVTKKYRVTDEGIQSVYPDGNFTLVKYDDKVGEKYTHKINGKTIVREVAYKSTEDEYAWGFMDIKIIRVTETGRGLNGVSKLEYILNHKFGLVGFKAYFEDGSTKEVRFFSKN